MVMMISDGVDDDDESEGYSSVGISVQVRVVVRHITR